MRTANLRRGESCQGALAVLMPLSPAPFLRILDERCAKGSVWSPRHAANLCHPGGSTPPPVPNLGFPQMDLDARVHPYNLDEVC